MIQVGPPPSKACSSQAGAFVDARRTTAAQSALVSLSASSSTRAAVPCSAPQRLQTTSRSYCCWCARRVQPSLHLDDVTTCLRLRSIQAPDITDGWSNTNGDSIINFVFVNPRIPPLFWKLINSKAEAHTAEYIAGTIWSTILEFESVIGSGKVTSVVTDNAANMKKAWRLVRKQRVELREDCSLSLVYHQFSWLCKHPVYTESLDGCSVLLQAEVLGLINARRDKICTPKVKIAYLLDQTKTMYVPNAQLAQDLQLIPAELAEKFHKQLQDFVLVKSAWKGKLREDNIAYSPIAWCIHGFIHTKLRNRLTPERVNKLVFVYTNIALKSEVNHILYQLYPDAYDDSDISDESDDEEDENVASNYQRATTTAMTTESEEKEDGETIQEAAVQVQNMFQTPPLPQSGTGQIISSRKRSQVSHALSSLTTVTNASMSDLVGPTLSMEVVLPTYSVQEAVEAEDKDSMLDTFTSTVTLVKTILPGLILLIIVACSKWAAVSSSGAAHKRKLEAQRYGSVI
ncbi:unnamed protein product [Phytophthora fragariaefolia]|uniref:Unnamed protein product n=1 Tax=Phytophthora fragariaefolia TaxID=1490495 RepID=A0A9W6Y606_9STRA|nr:unnamed protein product [Phytophthora fragariaefolia]